MSDCPPSCLDSTYNADPDELLTFYNEGRSHMALDWDYLEMLAGIFDKFFISSGYLWRRARNGEEY